MKRKETRRCLDQMPETNELISNYLDNLVLEAKENPYWCEAIVKANELNTGIKCSEEESFTYFNQQGQEMYMEDAFAISLIAEGLSLADEIGLEEKLERIRPVNEKGLFLLLPRMEGVLSKMGYGGVEKPLYSDADGVIKVEGQDPTARYENLTTSGDLSEDNMQRLRKKMSGSSDGNTGLFYVGGLFEKELRPQPELS